MGRIYIDTNIFFDFYRQGNDRMTVFKELFARADCIVVPEQTVKEFRRNRASLLMRLAKQVEDEMKVKMPAASIIFKMQLFDELKKTLKSLEGHVKEISKQLKDWANNEDSDPVYQEFVRLYTCGTTMSTPSDALKKAYDRKLIGDPPTSPGKQTIGDEVIWETLLSLLNDDLIIVSRDRTFIDNESILRQEFQSGKNRKLICVTKSLAEALRIVGKPSAPIEQAEKEEIENQQIIKSGPTEIGKCPKCSVYLEFMSDEQKDENGLLCFKCPSCQIVTYRSRWIPGMELPV